MFFRVCLSSLPSPQGIIHGKENRWRCIRYWITSPLNKMSKTTFGDHINQNSATMDNKRLNFLKPIKGSKETSLCSYPKYYLTRALFRQNKSGLFNNGYQVGKKPLVYLLPLLAFIVLSLFMLYKASLTSSMDTPCMHWIFHQWTLLKIQAFPYL